MISLYNLKYNLKLILILRKIIDTIKPVMVIFSPVSLFKANCVALSVKVTDFNLQESARGMRVLF